MCVRARTSSKLSNKKKFKIINNKNTKTMSNSKRRNLLAIYIYIGTTKYTNFDNFIIVHITPNVVK